MKPMKSFLGNITKSAIGIAAAASVGIQSIPVASKVVFSLADGQLPSVGSGLLFAGSIAAMAMILEKTEGPLNRLLNGPGE